MRASDSGGRKTAKAQEEIAPRTAPLQETSPNWTERL
jgi:hypothetical protein